MDEREGAPVRAGTRWSVLGTELVFGLYMLTAMLALLLLSAPSSLLAALDHSGGVMDRLRQQRDASPFDELALVLPLVYFLVPAWLYGGTLAQQFHGVLAIGPSGRPSAWRSTVRLAVSFACVLVLPLLTLALLARGWPYGAPALALASVLELSLALWCVLGALSERTPGPHDVLSGTRLFCFEPQESEWTWSNRNVVRLCLLGALPAVWVALAIVLGVLLPVLKA